MKTKLLIGVAAVALSWNAFPAWAQDAAATGPQASSNPGNLEEIVVTARKRQEVLFDVPGATSVVTGNQIANLKLEDARDLLTLIPTAFLEENNAGTARDISIRGIGTPNLFAEPGVALYQDEIYSNGFISYPTQFYDLERVEVLRGPQGALYGRDAVGGAVNVISKRPTNVFEGSVEGIYENYEHYELRGIVNVPVNDIFAVRALVWRTDQQHGEFYNQTLHRYIDKNDSTGGRFVAQLTPTDELTLRVVGEYSEANTPGTNLFFPTAGETFKTIERDTEPTNAYHTARLSVEAEYNSNFGVFTLIGGGRDYSLGGIEDTDLSSSLYPTKIVSSGQEITDRKNTITSRFLETRWLSPDFGPVNLLVGFTYLNDDAEGDIATHLNGYSLRFTHGQTPFLLAINNHQTVESVAGFAEATWKITPTLSLIGDLRYTDDNKGLNFAYAPSPALLQAFIGHPQTVDTNKTFTNWSEGGTLAWSPDTDTRLYAKIQTGFRAGGFNFNVGSAADLPYNQETSVNYEVGAKYKFDEGRGVVSVSIYDLEQDHVLISFFDTSVAGPLGSHLVNEGHAQTIGEELEVTYQLLQGLTLSGSVGHLDAKFTSGHDDSKPAIALDGKTLPSSRDWTTAVTTNYRHSVWNDIDFVFDASYAHREPGYVDIQNTSKFDGVDLVNASAGFDYGKYEIRAFVENATDDQYILANGGYRPPNAIGVSLAPGQRYGVKLRAGF